MMKLNLKIQNKKFKNKKMQISLNLSLRTKKKLKNKLRRRFHQWRKKVQKYWISQMKWKIACQSLVFYVGLNQINS